MPFIDLIESSESIAGEMQADCGVSANYAIITAPLAGIPVSVVKTRGKPKLAETETETDWHREHCPLPEMPIANPTRLVRLIECKYFK